MPPKKDYIKKHYKCGFCNTEFDREVIRVEGNGKKNHSSMVKCGCGNFLKTW